MKTQITAPPIGDHLLTIKEAAEVLLFDLA